jgi:hypothetical protein
MPTVTRTKAGGIPQLRLGDAAMREWIDSVLPLLALVALELAAMAHLRRYFRRHHGG